MPPHVRDIPIPGLEAWVPEGRGQLARRVAVGVHRRGARDWAELDLSPRERSLLEYRFEFGPLLRTAGDRVAPDGTRKFLFETRAGGIVETVLVRNRRSVTLCVSSQVGCAFGCTFCATGRIGLRGDLSPGEITESVLLSERAASVRVSDIVFMGQGEPLHNYDVVMAACTNLHSDLGACIARKRITISTVGLVPQIRRYTGERRPWRLHLSLHSAIQETRAELMPVARRHPLPEVLDAMREYQEKLRIPWLTFQYVAIPGVNMDDRHVDALESGLHGLRVILNVIPWNETGAAFRAPSWTEVKDFTTRLRRLRCPVKIRYSAGKQEGMGCGQLSAEAIATPVTGGHLAAPPGIFTG